MSRARDFADLAAAYSGSAQLSNRNLLHNGDMTISQRGTSATGVGASNGVALLDRWNWSQSSNGRVTMTQEAVTDLSGFFHCLKVATTTADTSIAAGEYVILSQGIESRGGLTQRMKKGYSDAEKLTLSFWAKANASATYCVSLRDNDDDRIINKGFTVGTSWERHTITFDGDTSTSDKPDVDHNATITLYFWLHAGATYNGNDVQHTNWRDTVWADVVDAQNTSIYDSTSRTFFITGVQLEVGEVATPFEHKSYEDNLAQCQRFFYAVVPKAIGAESYFGNGFNYNSSVVMGFIHFPVTMRAVPTLEIQSGTNDWRLYRNGGNDELDDFYLNSANIKGMNIANNSDASGTAGHAGGLYFNDTTNCYLYIKAEL